MVKITRKYLIDQIHLAFQDTPSPQSGVAGIELEDFTMKHWSDISAQTIRKYQDEFSSFSPEGFRFFLPAIITAVILHPEICDLAVENIVVYLSLPEPDNILYNYFQARSKLFTRAEKQAIALFLKSYREFHPYGWWTSNEESRIVLDKAITFWS